jgi:hypothetical protein
MDIHPGALAALRVLTGDELDVAELMRDGDLTSPQIVGNMTMFKIRITGVGYSYRPKLDEYVYRRPENYLTDRFLIRCSGLPVIYEHPEEAVLNSSEFSERIVGTVFLPFIAADEVWAIAKIWDKDAALEMSEIQLSTSPSVVFRDPGVNLRVDLEDGTHLLVEGPPSLLDHVAICRNGVWDKSEVPTGVIAQGAGEDLSEEVAEALSDALDGIARRMDTWAI